MMDVEGMVKVLEGFKLLPAYKRTVVLTDLWIDVQVAALRAAMARMAANNIDCEVTCQKTMKCQENGMCIVELTCEQAEAEFARLYKGGK